MNKSCCDSSKFYVVLAFLSILGSIAIWLFSQGDSPESVAHAERFGIFVGLWAPTFMGLANYSKSCQAKGENKSQSCCDSKS